MKVSVIVPVYNVQNYIHYALESLLAQTYTDYEVILVNDGSTDDSGRLCEEYASRYDHVYYYAKANGGQSDARNYGVAQAQAEWVTFLDPDDYLEPYSLSLMIELQRRYKADLVSTKVELTTVHEAYNGYTLMEADFRLSTSSQAEALEAMLYNHEATVSACGKLYRKSLIESHPFPVGKIYEDFSVAAAHVLAAQTIVVSPLVTYHYYQRSGSTVNSNFSLKHYDFYDAVEANRAFLPGFGNQAERVEAALNIKCVAGSFRLIDLIANAKQYGELDGIRRRLRVYQDTVRQSHHVSLQFKLKYQLFLWTPRLYLLVRKRNKT